MIQRKLVFVISLITIFTISCKKPNVNPNLGPGKPLVLTADEQQKADAGNGFTFSLLKNVYNANAAGNTNLFISPLSVGFALGMTSNGANGQTQIDIRSALNFSGFTEGDINSYYSKLLTDLPQLDPNTTLRIANSVWYRQGLDVLPSFIKTDSSYYHAHVQSLDFNDPSSANVINGWVSSQTNGKIPAVVGQPTPYIMMYLINAIYFKSVWKEKFAAANTRPQNFYRADNSVVQADFMSGKIDFNAYGDTSMSVVELPYANNRFSMVILMPRQNATLKSVINGLTAAKWQTITANLRPENTDISLPKFKFSYDINLNKVLMGMGMSSAFSDQADFTNLSSAAGLHISQVLHKAYVAVDESGTEAAAATSVAVGLTATAGWSIDRPFIFVIREMNTGLILFAGTMNDPSAM